MIVIFGLLQVPNHSLFYENRSRTMNICCLLIILTSSFFPRLLQAGTESYQTLEPITLQLPWMHQFQFAGYYAAKKQGFFADEGLDVKIQTIQNSKSVVDQVILREADYGIDDISILLDYTQGSPINALAAIFQHNSLVYISKQSSGIFSLKDMRGKRIMQTEIHAKTENVPLGAMLAAENIKNDDYISVKNSFSLEELLTDQVDVMSAYLTDQPYTLSQMGVEINVFRPQDYAIDFYGDILFTSEQELKLYPGRATRFLKASLKGWQYAFDHTEEVIQLIKNQYHSTASIQRLRNEAIEIRKLVKPDTTPLGEITVERLRHIADVYTSLNIIPELRNERLTEFIYDSTNKLNLSQQEKQWLQQHPIIRVGIDKNFAPYEWINNKGQYKGIAADYMKLLEQRLNVKFEFVSMNTWNEVLGAAQKGALDMLSCVVKTAERESFLNFSKPYQTSTAVIISEHSTGYIGTLKHLKGHRVAIQEGHYTIELLEKDFPDIEIISTGSIEQALRMVADGQVHSYVGDVTSASYVMKKEGLLNLVFSGTTPYLSKFSVATTKNNPLLASIISKALITISQQERDEIIGHWQAFKINQGINVQTVFKYAILIFTLFFIFVYWIYRLRRSENALKASEAKLKLILDTELEGVYVLDAEGRLLQMNLSGLKMIGAHEITQVIGKKVENLVIEEYKQAFNEMNAQVLKGETSTLEYQIKSLKGKVRWIDSHAVPLIDNKKNNVSILAVSRDITERKKTDEAQKLAALVYQNSSEAMMILDKNNRIIAINPAFTQITGYSFDEVKGKNPKILQSELPDDNFYGDIWHSIEKTGVWTGELWNKRKNGDLYAERLIINTIFSKNGEVEQRVALFSDITEKKETEKLIWVQANFDQLTRLPNRNMFLDRLNQDIKIANRTENSLALIYLDLDHFKEVNDILGHDKGDELLCEVSTRLASCVRDSDTVARLGGDEFIVILSDLDEMENIDRIAQNIIQVLSRVYMLDDEQAYISASLGIALYPGDATQSDELIKLADQAMYLSKQSGGSQFNYFTKELQQQSQYRLQLMNDMRGAIVSQQFELYYQPIVDLHSGKIVKAEALIRWNHPVQGIVNPIDFIPLAENSGVIIEIGEWVFKQAAQQIKRWRDLYNNDLQVSVNKSPVQFWAAKNRNEWLDFLNKIGLSGESIAIEITESIFMDNVENIDYQLMQYKQAGVQISMDDFGTGYSALSYLNKFDLDYLKIDRSFTQNLADSSSDMALSEAIILMSHKLGLKVIAEGIENELQRQLLIQAGCDYGQGFLFSKPVTATDFESLFLGSGLTVQE